MSTLFGKKSKKHAQKRVRSEDEDEEYLQQQQQDLQVLEVPQQTTTRNNKNVTPSSSSTAAIIIPAPAVLLPVLPSWSTFADLGLADPLVTTCRQLGLKRPTAVQRTIIPFLLQNSTSHVLALASTGSGKTAAFLLPILQHLSVDPYGIFAVILTPTRELAKQIHQQVLAFGSSGSSSSSSGGAGGYNVRSCLCIGGVDAVRQSLDLSNQRPHFCVATPGRLAELLRGPSPPALNNLRFMVLDEADRLLASNSGFERDVAELLLHSTHHYQQQQNQHLDSTSVVGPTLQQGRAGRPGRAPCQTLLFSATMSRSLQNVEEMAGAGMGRLPLTRFVIQDDDNNDNDKKRAAAVPNKKIKTQHDDDDDDDDETTSKVEPDDNSNSNSNSNNKNTMEESLRPKIPAGLKQEYIFMPSRVRDAYLLAAIRNLMMNGGRPISSNDGRSSSSSGGGGSGWTASVTSNNVDNDEHDNENSKARSAIIFVSTCERAAFVSGILTTMGVQNVALHSLLSQNRRLASLGKFKSQQVCVMVATDVASRGLDIPTVDLVLNSELPRNAINYVHRCGRTARANRRGRAISFVAESDIALVHAAESISGRALEKCSVITDDLALKMLGPVAKAARLTRIKLNDIGFDELVQKFKERKARDAKERARIDRALRKMTTKKCKNKSNSNKNKMENP